MQTVIITNTVSSSLATHQPEQEQKKKQKSTTTKHKNQANSAPGKHLSLSVLSCLLATSRHYELKPKQLQGHMQMCAANRRQCSGTCTAYWQMLQTDTHHWTFVSLQQDCGYHGLRFGGFSPANEILTPWQSSDRDKTEQYELSALILLRVCNCSLWKWDGGSLADRHCWEGQTCY